MSERLSPEQADLVEKRVKLATALGHKAWLRLSGYERDEIISWAYQGLMSAAARWPAYCAQHGYEMYTPIANSWFDTYCTRRINGTIIDQLRALDVATRRERATIKQMIEAGVDLSGKIDRESPAAIAARIGIPVIEVKRAFDALARTPVSMDEVAEESRPVDPSCVETQAEASVLGAKLVEAVLRLPTLAQQVVVLFAYSGLTDAEIARELTDLEARPRILVTVASVRQIRSHAQKAVTESLRKELITTEQKVPVGG